MSGSQIGRLLAVAVLLAPAAPAAAVEVHGNLRVYDGSTDNAGAEADQLDQKFTLNLRQALTPWLSLVFTYRYTDFESDSDGADFDRSSSDPRLELLYDRPTLSARLSFQDRRNRGSNPSDNLDIESFLAQLRWQPKQGPWYSLHLRDDTNVADTAVFGRDVSSRTFGAEAVWDRRLLGARYAFQATRLANERTGFSLDEDRHQLRADYDQRFWGDKLALSTSGWINRVEQREVAGSGGRPAQTVPIRDGLFALDTSPDLGELDDAPGLIDGDAVTPVTPAIEIGGANTFRNLGVDLGFTRQVTRLEITVDAPSTPGLSWEVYHSSDGLVWNRISGVASEYDGALSRYTLTFPETTDRFFKAVNVTVNGFTSVEVTELRALVDVGQLGRREGRSTTYRADFGARWRPYERVRADVHVGLANDQDLTRGLLSRDLDERSYGAQVRVDLTSELEARVGYRFTSVDEDLAPVLARDEEDWTAALDWSPLPTVDGLLSFSRRDETDGEVLIRSADTLRLRARTELLATLELTSEVTWSDVDDPFAGFQQTVWRWRETLVADLTERLNVRASVARSYFDSTGTVVIEERTNVDLLANWRAAPFLSFTGDWAYGEDDLQDTLTQRYSTFYAPGPKLSASFSYQDTETSDVRQTTTMGASINYRIRPRLTPFAYFSRSTFRQAGTETSDNTSLRFGFNLFF
jgi:hypothetical protein